MRKKQRKTSKPKTKRSASRSKRVRNKRPASKTKTMPRAGRGSKQQKGKRAQKLQRKRPIHNLKGKSARRVLIYADGRELAVVVSVRMASLVGKYMAGVRWFVQTNDLHHIEPFVGRSITDMSGKRYPLETRPNALHRLAHTGASSFEQIYRIVI